MNRLPEKCSQFPAIKLNLSKKPVVRVYQTRTPPSRTNQDYPVFVLAFSGKGCPAARLRLRPEAAFGNRPSAGKIDDPTFKTNYWNRRPQRSQRRRFAQTTPYGYRSKSSREVQAIESRKIESTKARKGSCGVKGCFDLSNFRAFMIHIVGLRARFRAVNSFASSATFC